MATARALLLGGGYTAISVLTAAFQPAAPAGSSANAVVLGENVVRFHGTSLSLPEVTRSETFEGSVFYNFGSMSITNVRVDDGGRRLPPGMDGHTVRINGTEYPAVFDSSSTKLGHWLPVPAGTEVLVEILNRDTGGVSWHGTILCDTQVTQESKVHLSLSLLRASIEFDRGQTHIIIPATDTSIAVQVLSTLLCGLYLIGIASVCSDISVLTTVRSLLTPETPAVTVPEDSPREPLLNSSGGPVKSKTAVVFDLPVDEQQSILFGLRLFLVDSSANAIGVCVSGLMLSYSLLQTLRTGIALVGSAWATVAVGWMVLSESGREWSASTLRMCIEASLLSGIAIALGVYSLLAQFSAIVFSVGIVGVLLRNGFPSKKDFSPANWYMDVSFRVGNPLFLCACRAFSGS